MLNFFIAVIVFILGKFIWDSFNQNKEMKAQGGVRKKYAKIIDTLLAADTRAKITQETNTFVNVSVVSPAGFQSYRLYQTFGTLTVEIVIKNIPLGNIKIERTFPENMDQEQIIQILRMIEQQEIAKKLKEII